MITGDKIVEAFEKLKDSDVAPHFWGTEDGTDVDGQSIVKALGNAFIEKNRAVWGPELGDHITFLSGVMAGIRTTLLALKEAE